MLGGRALLQLVGAQLVAVVHGQPAVGQLEVRTQLAAVLDQEVLVGRAGPELQHPRVVAVGGLEGAGPERHHLVRPAGQVAEVGAECGRGAAVTEVVADDITQ